MNKQRNTHEEIFTDIYKRCEWGNNKEEDYSGSSGGGSSLHFNTGTYIPFLKDFIVTNKIQSIVDLGCGDFICGPLIYDSIPNIKYFGYETYSELVKYHTKKYNSQEKYTFYHLDFFSRREEIYSADLCILKDVLQHWDTPEIYTLLDYLVDNKKFKFILIINCKSQQKEDRTIKTGAGGGLISTMYPLKKYNARRLYEYGTKEVSVITLDEN
jgi:hypothetical protein